MDLRSSIKDRLLFSLQVILDGINNILKMAGPRVEEVATLIEECDGLSKIEELENHENTEIYKLAYEIIEKFFSGNVTILYIVFNTIFTKITILG